MKVSELQEKTVEELEAQVIELRKQHFELRTQMATGQLGQTHLLREAKKDIARVKTVLTQKAGS